MATTSTFTSKHFEDNVALLRNEVSRYLERGICVLDHSFVAPSVLININLVFSVCKEIAKAKGNPFVSVEFFKFSGLNNGFRARVKMPLTVKAKPLSGMAMLIGVNKRSDRGGYYDYPIVLDRKSTGLDIYYNSEKGKQALHSWLEMCATDKALRFALGLPTIVTR